MNGYRTLFNRDPENHIYPFFWQHGEDESVLREYIRKIDESGMKAICIEARPHPEFLKEKWWKDFDIILEECKKREMKIWILDDSHFPTGYANGRIKKDYPQYLKTYIDIRRYDIHGPLPDARIDFHYLAGLRKQNVSDDCKILGVYMAQRAFSEDDINDPIDAGSLHDISEQMSSDRLLTLDIPAGAYSVFVVYETMQGGEETTKDYLNPLVSEATRVLLDEVYEKHYQHYAEEFGKTIQGFFSDEPRFGNAKGTNCGIGSLMPLPWRNDLEKDLSFDMKYLPLLWYPANGKEAEIRYLYMDLITREYDRCFTKVLADWCNERGVFYLGHNIEDNGSHARLGYGTGHFFRGQKHMDFAGVDTVYAQVCPGMNYHHESFATGGNDGVFYHYALAKLASSAAHLDPKKEGRSMCEAFGAYGWNEGLKMMKWIADHLMVRGINHIVPHAFSPKEFPDPDCPPHFYARGKNPQFRYFHVLSSYMNRIMSIFSDGIYPCEVAVLYPAESEWMGRYMPIEKISRELMMNQVSFEIISCDHLMEAAVNDKSFEINSHSFSVLVMPYSEYVTEQIAYKIQLLCERGISVIVMNELPRIVSTNKMLEVDCKICCIKDLRKRLEDYRIFSSPFDEKALLVNEYIKDGKLFYYLFNENMEKTLDIELSFKVNGNLYEYDAFSDRLYRCTDRKTSMAPYQARIFVVSDEIIDVQQHKKTVSSLQINGSWKIELAEAKDYPSFTVIAEESDLKYVNRISGYEDFSGTVRYSKTINLKEKCKALLKIENAFETTEVFVNGESCGVCLCPPYEFDLSDKLQEGDNRIEIEITNTLGTNIRDGFSHYLPIEPFGTEGRIELLFCEERDS